MHSCCSSVARGLTYLLRITLAACIYTFAVSTAAYSDTHYVSKTGSNTHPYTSWVTATDSVRAAIDAAEEWDTVLVGQGEFTSDSLPLKKGLAFVGSGIDSTHILHNGTFPGCIVLADSALVEGFSLSGLVDTSASGFLTYRLTDGIYGGTDVSGIVRNNRVSNVKHAVTLFMTDNLTPSKRVAVEGNVFSNYYDGIWLFGASGLVRKNSFLVNNNSIGSSIYQLLATEIVLEGNVFTRLGIDEGAIIDLRDVRRVEVNNNIWISPTQVTGWSLLINPTSPGYPTVGEIANNLVIGSSDGIVSLGGNLVIRNNIIVGTGYVDLRYDQGQTTPGNVRFNLFWNNQNLGHSVDTAARIASGSVFAHPMFVDSLDFHLQAFSPAIDAGDTLLQDPDGSRSDIGPYGGPLGETYAYVDLPPHIPADLTGTASDSEIVLTWHGNHEADFSRYELYRDTVPIPAPNPSLLLASVSPESSYSDRSVTAGGYYYYRLRTVDAQQNASGLSGELPVIASGVTGQGDPTLPTGAHVSPNYPNPFNTATWIPFVVSLSGSHSYAAVRLTIHDVIGRRIRVLVDEVLPAGAHRVHWDGTDEQGRAVASGVYVARLSVEGYEASRKILLLK